MDYGALWSSLKLGYASRKIPWTNDKVQAFSGVIKRAEEAPMSLLVSVAHRKRFTTDAPNLVEKLISPHAHHLRSLALKCVAIEHLSALPSGLFPQLERLAMAFDPKQLSKFDWTTQGPIQAFSNAPSLQRVALRQRQVDFEYAVDFDWSTHFVLPWD